LSFDYSLSSINNHVHENLLNLSGIGFNYWKMFFEIVSQCNVGRHRTLDQRNGLSDTGGQVDPLKQIMSLAGIGEHLAGQFGSPLASPDDIHDPISYVRLGLDLIQN
jgi:hypothetical protein